MKNIYELSSKEKSKYRKEFNKIEYAKSINKKIGWTLGLYIICIFICACQEEIITGSFDDFQIILKDVIDLVDSIGTLSLILLVLEYLIREFSFIRWMKIKHEIEY